MPATVIAERVGWTRGMTVFKQRVRELRPLYAPADPVQRTTYPPGEVAQFDLWLPDVEIPVGGGQHAKLWVEVGVLGFSRYADAVMIGTRETHDVLAGHWRVLERLGGVPREAVWDGEGAIGRRRDHVPGFARATRPTALGRITVHAPSPEEPDLIESFTSWIPSRLLAGVRRDVTVQVDLEAVEIPGRGCEWFCASLIVL